MSETFTVVLPVTSDDPVSDWLVALTERVCNVMASDGAGGILGGAFGYGENYENEVFMLHRFCWCESSDCAWCVGCACPEDAARYFLGEREVSCADFFDAGGHMAGTVRHDPAKQCAYCKGEVKPAPNFLHKPTGATVHWYKYIGRGMEVSEADWPAIFRDCFASLDRSDGGSDGG